MSGVLDVLLVGFTAVAIAYFFVLDAVYGLLLAIGWRAVDHYVRIRPARDYVRVSRSPLAPGLTVVAPAYNEGRNIVVSARSLLASRYEGLQVVVVDDGSTDDTLQRLVDAFALVPVDRVPRWELAHRPVHQVYVSAHEPRLTVVAKENGGKADALNAGIDFVTTPLFCSIDGDTLLDRDALARLVWEFEIHPDTVAAGGIVRVVNGSTLSEGRLTWVRTPRNVLVNIQILEYLRAFLGGRIAWSRLGMLLIISGAFGLFRTESVVAAGGYDTTTVGEDAELVLRLHRHHRERGVPARVIFFPDPICWTEAPESLRVLTRQRDRWQRGLIEMLLKHRRMMLRPRYGLVGMFAMPFFAVFEAFGPVIETIGYLWMPIGLLTGYLSPHVVLLFFALAVTFGFVLSYFALLIEERAFARYPTWGDLGRLVLASVVENLGYRQLQSLVRGRAWITAVTRRGVWGEMVRIGIGEEDEDLAPAAPKAPGRGPGSGEA